MKLQPRRQVLAGALAFALVLPLKPASAYRGIARGIDTRLPDEPDRL